MRTYTQNISSNSRDGTTYHSRQEETGKPTVEETRHIPPTPTAGSGSGSGGQVQEGYAQSRVEDVTDRDEEYLERMEDEYAKREGGA
jgi:hypothetical protein